MRLPLPLFFLPLLLAACELGLSQTGPDDPKPDDSDDPWDSEDPNDSDPDDLAPVADAGSDQIAQVDAVVELDGHSSYDPEGQDLAFDWEILVMPPGSGVTLVNPTFADPVFIPDRPGTFEIQLTVHDGTLPSAPDAVLIDVEAPGDLPVANAGSGQTVEVGDSVRLDGSGSYDPGGEALIYGWYFRTLPSGSTATLSNPASVSPSFTADLEGTYDLGLVASDSTSDSEPDTTIVIAAVDSGGDDCGFGCAREAEIALRKRLGGTALVLFPLFFGWRIRRREDL